MASYYVYSGAGGSANGSSWANAFTSLVTAFATEIAGDTLYVAHDHVESGATITLTSSGTVGNPTKVICVNRAGSVPPVSADRRATAQISTTTNGAMNIQGSAHYDGIIFICGASTGTAILTVTTTIASHRFDNCSLRVGSTGGGRIVAGGGAGTFIELNNTTCSFSGTGQGLQVGSLCKWKNTPSALLGTLPNNIIVPTSSGGGLLECIGVDFSSAGSGKTLAGTGTANNQMSYRFLDCKLNAAVTKSAVPGTPTNEVDFIRSGSSGINYTVHRHRISGLLVEETTIVRTGGASDGTTPLAWKIDTTANCNYSLPFDCPPIVIWNDTIGSSVTATVEGIWGGGAVPLDNEIWLECEYLGDASSPMGSFVNDGTVDLLTTAANQTSSSATWGGSTTKFKLGVTFTPQQRGWVYAHVKVGKPSSTFYVDPMVALS